MSPAVKKPNPSREARQALQSLLPLLSADQLGSVDELLEAKSQDEFDVLAHILVKNHQDS